MSDTLRIIALRRINSANDIINGPDWVRQHAGHTNYGFVLGGAGYDFGNWMVQLSNDEIQIYTDAFLQMIAASLPAFKEAGLIEGATGESNNLSRFTTAFIDEIALIYVKPDLDYDDDNGEIVVLERAPHRDPLTTHIDPQRTWVIIASEYLSGQVVEGMRLSAFTAELLDRGVKHRLGARGPETV